MRIDARGVYYKKLNESIHHAVKKGETDIILDNINGQRYIGTGLSGNNIRITINGVAGNDLAAFMDGPAIYVFGNGQDGIANTMNSGKVVIHGNAGDIAGHAMRGGRLFIKGDAGYRIGIHMKSYEKLFPVIIIGGNAGDFLGEYMAGGVIVVLGLNAGEEPLVGNYVATGMHGGKIYIRGKIEDYQLGKEPQVFNLNEDDQQELKSYLKEYCQEFNLSLKEILAVPFVKLIPTTSRPYGKLYAY